MMSKKILMIKYILFIFIFLKIIESKIPVLGFIGILIIFIFTNIRIFHISNAEKKEYLVYIEWISTIVIFLILKISLVFYMPIIIIDLFTGLNLNKKNYVVIVCLFISIIELIFDFDEVKFLYICVSVIIYFLVDYIVSLEVEKLNIEKLYDRLRISEDELKKAHLELEIYSKSSLELAVLKERNRISREVHDGVGHVLSTVMIQLSAMERVASVSKNPLLEMLKGLREFVSSGFSDVKIAIRALKPDEYSNYDNIIRISELCKNAATFSGVDIKCSVTGSLWSIDDFREGHLYRIIQELISNSLKYSKATKININFKFCDDCLIIVFKDNGVGTDKLSGGLGIKNIKERTFDMSGTVFLDSQKDRGFFAKIILPKKYRGQYGEN